MIINRLLANEILAKLRVERSKIIVIYGPRQVGKTTLAKDVLTLLNKKTMLIDCDSLTYNDVLSSRDIDKFSGLV